MSKNWNTTAYFPLGTFPVNLASISHLWPQDLGTAGCPTAQLHQEGWVVPCWNIRQPGSCHLCLGSCKGLNSLRGSSLTSWLTALSSSYYAKCWYLQNMQNLSFIESNSCSVTKLSSGKADAGFQMHQDTCHGSMNQMLMPQCSWIQAAICNCSVMATRLINLSNGFGHFLGSKKLVMHTINFNIPWLFFKVGISLRHALLQCL